MGESSHIFPESRHRQCAVSCANTKEGVKAHIILRVQVARPSPDIDLMSCSKMASQIGVSTVGSVIISSLSAARQEPSGARMSEIGATDNLHKQCAVEMRTHRRASARWASRPSAASIVVRFFGEAVCALKLSAFGPDPEGRLCRSAGSTFEFGCHCDRVHPAGRSKARPVVEQKFCCPTDSRRVCPSLAIPQKLTGRKNRGLAKDSSVCTKLASFPSTNLFSVSNATRPG
jgi:hypothetical protein